MKRRKFVWTRAGMVAGLGVLMAIGACGSDDDGENPTDVPETFSLTFSGDGTFTGGTDGAPHGGQDIYVVVEDATGAEVAFQQGTVATSGDETFSFTFTDALEEGEDYVIKYWIDSNFGGGTVGVCEAIDVDHQWLIDEDEASDLTDVSGDVTFEDTHRPSEREDVCEAFAAHETGGGNGGGGNNTVTTPTSAFSPNELEIEVGESVTWENMTGVQHNVTPVGHTEWTAADLSGGVTFEHTFNTARDYDYQCTLHSGMDGTITVVEPASTAY